MLQKLKLSTNIFTRKYAPKLLFLIEKNIRRIQMILDIHFENQILALFDDLSPVEVTKYSGFL